MLPLLPLLVALGLGAPAWAQGFSGGASGSGVSGAGAAGAGGGQGASSTSTTTKSAGLSGGAGAVKRSGVSASGVSGPSTLYGLKPARGPVPVITLAQALDDTAQHNYDLRIAAEQIVQARTVIRRAWSSVLPRLTAASNYIYTTPVVEVSFLDQDAVDQQKQQLDSQALILRTLGDMSAPVDPARADELYRSAAALEDASRDLKPMKPIALQPPHVLNANVQLTVPIFNGRSIPLIQGSYDLVEQAKLSFARGRQQALFGVATLYYSALTLKKMTGITDNNAQSAQSHLEATQARVAAGALPAIALKRAQFDLLRAQQTRRATQSSYLLLLGSLGQMMGRDTLFDIAEPAEVEAIEQQGGADAFYLRAQQSRLDLKALRVSMRAARRGELDYWLSYAPSLNLVGKAGWTSNTSGFQTDPLIYNVVLAASLPLYDGGGRYAARDETHSKIRQARLTIDKTESEIAGLIRGNLQDIALRSEGLESARLAVELAAESHQNAKALFEVGAATNLEVIDAGAAELAAQIDLARAELELRLSRLGLLFVVGEYPPVDASDEATASTP